MPLHFVELSSNLGILIVTASGVLSYFFLTRVIKIEHDDFPAQWEKDGKPHGMPFWFPMKELGELGFRSDPWSRGYRWLFKTPEWVKTHAKASQMLGWFRFTIYSAFFILFLMFAIVFVSMPPK